MAEILGVTASIAGIISLADTVYQHVFRYTRGVTDAKDEVKQLAQGINALSGVLRTLYALANVLETRDQLYDPALKVQYLVECQETIERIRKRVKKATDDFDNSAKWRGLSRRLKWPFSGDETRDLLSNIARYTATITLAASADTLRQLQVSLSLQSKYQQETMKLHTDINKKVEITAAISLNTKKQSILDFFMGPDLNPQPSLEQNIGLHQPTTGNWLLELEEVKNWFHTPGSRLWMNGIAGGGKTILATIIIREALSRNLPDYGRAFFFCDYKKEATLSPVNILGAIATQLALQKDECFACLENYYADLHPERHLSSKPDVDELRARITQMALSFSQVLIVIDGIDECQEGIRQLLLDSLRELADSSTNIGIALFSRDEIDIRMRLDTDFEHISIEAHTEDITIYVRAEMERRRISGQLVIITESIKLEIEKELITRAHGILVVPSRVRRKATAKYLVEAGATRSASTETYFTNMILFAWHLRDFSTIIDFLSDGGAPTDTDLKSLAIYFHKWRANFVISRQLELALLELNNHLHDTALLETSWGFELGTLIWSTAVFMGMPFTGDSTLTDTRISLSLHGLKAQMKVAVKNDDVEALRKFLKDRRVDKEDCWTSDNTSPTTLLQDAAWQNAGRCFDLLLGLGSDPYALSGDGHNAILRINTKGDGSLLDTAVRHGVDTLEPNTDGANLWHMVALKPSNLQFFDALIRTNPEGSRKAMFDMTVFGMTPLCIALRSSDANNDYEYGQPFVVREAKALKFIEYCNTVPQFWDKHDSILNMAFDFGSIKVMEKLIEIGVCPTAPATYNPSPLHHLSPKASPSWVCFLKRMFPGAIGQRYEDRLPLETYLSNVIEKKTSLNQNIATMLITRARSKTFTATRISYTGPRVEQQTCMNETGSVDEDAPVHLRIPPLLHHVSEGSFVVADILLQMGANVNLKVSHSSKAVVHECVRLGNVQFLQKLVALHRQKKQEIDWERNSVYSVKLPGSIHQIEMSPLHMACSKGKDECFGLLLNEVNASMEKKASRGLTALHFAAMSGNTAIIYELVRLGHSVVVYDDTGDTPLHLAADNGHLFAVKSLIDLGALDTVNTSDSTARTLAVRNGYNEICPSDRDAVITGVINKIDGVLHYAVRGNNLEIVKLLLQHGVDIDRLDSSGRSVLLEAKTTDMVALLLRFGISLGLLVSECAYDLVDSWLNASSSIIDLLFTAILNEGLHHALRVLDWSSDAMLPMPAAISGPIIEIALLDYASVKDLPQQNYIQLLFDRQGTQYLHSSGFLLEDLQPFPWNLIEATEVGNLTFLRENITSVNKLFGSESSNHWLNLNPTKGWSPLCRAASMNHVRAMENCLSLGAEIDFEGSPLGSALMIACACGQLSAVKLLVRKGANPFYYGKYGWISVMELIRSKVVRRWLLVGRFTDQMRLQWDSDTPTPGMLAETGQWRGPIQMRVKLNGFEEIQEGESSFGYAIRLAAYRRSMYGSPPQDWINVYDEIGGEMRWNSDMEEMAKDRGLDGDIQPFFGTCSYTGEAIFLMQVGGQDFIFWNAFNDSLYRINGNWTLDEIVASLDDQDMEGLDLEELR
ncbi:unnamed protein product [Fusarium equiseti]|uniref:NACHT domain-containing protein n=1 Tax=Fusarium equiseti TaxID=61235 RepID=A0A8J2IPC2_FUSEQ|nr:unnamed protein product [Fusarium equiseti]